MFVDRTAAGRQLAHALAGLSLRPPIVVLGLPRGGVPLAREVARALHAPLDVMVVRKIGMPGQPELAIGAIASGDVVIGEGGDDWNVSALTFQELVARERRELVRRERVYRGHRPALELHGKTALLVDDGVATGATMMAAVRAAYKAGAAVVVVAAPVASAEAAQRLEREADRLVILQIPPLLSSIGEWYERFDQLEDAEVIAALQDTGGGPLSTRRVPGPDNARVS